MTDTAGVPGASPSGSNPICCGVREKMRSASIHIVSAMTIPIAAAAVGNPSAPIAITHSGEKMTPPMLPPLYAIASAAGRVRTNQGETSILMAAALIAPQPAPLSKVDAKSCQGAAATAQPKTPTRQAECAGLGDCRCAEAPMELPAAWRPRWLPPRK